ncbi:MAG: hypothetical protein ACRDU5_12080 [Mycobacterium sp.]
MDVAIGHGQSGPSGTGGRRLMSFEATAFILTWTVLALLGLALSGVVRQLHLLQQRIPSRLNPGPRIGAPFPDHHGASARRNRPSVLLFASASCPPCRDVIPVFTELSTSETWAVFVLVAPDGDGFGNSTLSDEQDDAGNRVEIWKNQQELLSTLRINALPYGVLVDRDGRIAGAAPCGSDAALRGFVTDMREKVLAS